MMGTIGADVVQKVYRVVISTETEEQYQARLEAQRKRQADLMKLGPASGPGQKSEPVRRQVAKVGRNDPCPCGSGKKYKKCHGLTDDLHP